MIPDNCMMKYPDSGTAWNAIKLIVETFGNKIIDEDRHAVQELDGICFKIITPGANWPVKGSGWDIPALNTYVNKEILGVIPPSGFEYTYGQRLFNYDNCFNQIQNIIRRLEKNKMSRRAVAVMLEPFHDAYMKEIPCLQTISCRIRKNMLHMTATFRSWDVGRAAVPNMYGLYRLMEYIAKNVGVEIGTLTIFATVAQIYEV